MKRFQRIEFILIDENFNNLFMSQDNLSVNHIVIIWLSETIKEDKCGIF